MLKTIARACVSKNIVKDFQFASRHCLTNNDVPTELYSGANQVLEDSFMGLDWPEEKVCAEYVFVGGAGEMRGKTRILHIDPEDEVTLDDCPGWSYDGSSTAQSSGGNSDIMLTPVSMYPDPFRRGRHVIVLCETFMGDGSPTLSNTRAECALVHEKVAEHELIYAFEQEYILYENSVPLGWPIDGSFPHAGQGQYYCAVGPDNILGRNFVEAHMRACMYAGLAFDGINGEVMLGQWEYQLGPIGGLEVADELQISRYLLHRIGEYMNLAVNIHPKPITERTRGGWNGSGNHVNCSSKEMRVEGGLVPILDAVKKFEATHKKHMDVYGEDNEMRLSGLYETQHIDKFSCGVADRGSSIRIQRKVFDQGYGWFEDRRPASNCDPYLVVSRIAKTLYDLNDLHIEMEVKGIDFDF